jgi:integrase
MKPTIDPYGHEKRYEASLRNLQAASNIKPADKTAIQGFVRQMLLNNIGKARAAKCIFHLTVLARNKKPTFNDCTRREIERLVDWLNNQPYSDYTRSDYLVILKRFYQWMRGIDPGDHDYPSEVKWIRVRRKKKRILPETLLTREDIERLIRATENPRDRALILTHYESGCRIGEILSLRIENVSFDRDGAVLVVNGKTGSRRVRIVVARHALSQWLAMHPKGGDPNSYVWLGVGTVGRHKPLNYESVRRIYRNLTKRTGVEKRVYTHLFRHTRATELAKSLTEAELKEYLGWVQDSRMASHYVYLSGRDIDAAILRASGRPSQEQMNTPILTAESCRECGRDLSLGYTRCPYCGSQTRSAIIPQAQSQESRRIADIVRALVADDEMLALIRRKLEQFAPAERRSE